jgi:MobL relaxases
MEAHLRYIAHRPDHDKTVTRSFFSSAEDALPRRYVMEEIKKEVGQQPVVAHKLIISPSISAIHMKSYVREVMNELGTSAGLDLKWYAVIHTNTEHVHAHVVVLPVDKFGRRVRIYKEDYARMREVGDRYLQRNRYLDRDHVKVREEERPNSFVERLKSAAKMIYKTIQSFVQQELDDLPPVSNKTREANAFGHTPTWAEIEARRRLREERQPMKLWRAYIKPIEIRSASGEVLKYHRRKELPKLRELERDFKYGVPLVKSQMTDEDNSRLQSWIKELYKEEKMLEREASKIQEIKVRLSAEKEVSVGPNSELKELKQLKHLHDTAGVNLTEREHKALTDWITKSSSKPKPKEQDRDIGF